MKITISPSQDQSQRKPYEQHPILAIEVPDDDLNIDEMFECLIIPMLRCMGFHQDAINKYFES